LRGRNGCRRRFLPPGAGCRGVARTEGMGGRSQAGRESRAGLRTPRKWAWQDSPPRRPQTSAIDAQVRQGIPRKAVAFHSGKVWRFGRESRSPGLVPGFHSMRVEAPSPSWSRWAKPGLRVSIPCSPAHVSGMPSGETWPIKKKKSYNCTRRFPTNERSRSEST